jgi:hypothetical protein
MPVYTEVVGFILSLTHVLIGKSPSILCFDSSLRFYLNKKEIVKKTKPSGRRKEKK